MRRTAAAEATYATEASRTHATWTQATGAYTAWLDSTHSILCL